MLIDPEQVDRFQWADQLDQALWDDVIARPPEQAAQATGARWLEGRFHLPLLGRAYAVDPAARRLWQADRPEARVGFQAGLVLLTHLARARGVPPAGRLITPQEMPGGGLFFTGPHAINARPLEQAFGDRPSALLARAQALGGAAYADAGADQGVCVPGLPHLPLYVLLWAGDEEFPPRAVVGLDAHAQHQLALDGIWALTNLLVRRLTK